MCQLYPSWILTKGIRKYDDTRGKTNTEKFEKDVGKTLDNCDHSSISRLGNGKFFCHQCEKELKLCLC